MNKRGQFRLSFAMIFSIIIIIAIVAIASYVTINFLRLGKCTEVGLFYNDLEKEVNKAWQSTIYQDTFTEGSLPSSIEFVCFGDLTQAYQSPEFKEQFDFLSKFRRHDKNVFLYPTQEACDSNLAFSKLEHVQIDEFFCAPITNSKTQFRMEKGEFDALVKLSK